MALIFSESIRYIFLLFFFMIFENIICSVPIRRVIKCWLMLIVYDVLELYERNENTGIDIRCVQYDGDFYESAVRWKLFEW